METIRNTLSTLLWLALLVIVGVASMSSVRWTSPAVHMESSFGPSRDLSYAMVLGLMILIVAALTPWTRVTYRRSFLAISTGLVVVGIVVSSLAASDKALALYWGSGLLIGLILMVCTRRLADRPWKIRLAVIVVVTLGAVFATKAWIREKIEIDQTWQNYLEMRNDFWAKQGKTLDDPTVKMFEARMLSRDNGGFFFHGNLGGMYLATVLFVGLGLVVDRWRRKDQPLGTAWLIGAGVLVLTILSALVLTLSKGAILATTMTLLILAAIWVFRRQLTAHFRTSVIGTALLLLITVGVVVGYGLTKQTLPTLSMAYRWQYWTASYHMFLDHPLAGVGLGNYGHYYQRYKLPEAEEEVTSPHNYIVQGFTQMGVIGGLGFTLLPIAILYQIARSCRSSIQNQKSKIKNSPPGPAAPLVMLYVGGGIFLILFLFNQSGLPGPFYLLAEYFPYLLVFAVAFPIACFRGDRFDTIENDPPGPGLVLCLAGALVVFTLGDLVNFSLEEPSTQILFFFLAGVTLAAAHPPEPSEAGIGWLNAAAAVGLSAYTAVLAVPGFEAESAAVRSEKIAPASDPSYDGPYQTFSELAERYGYDAHLAAQAGKRLFLMAQSQHDPGVAREAADWLTKATQRAPAVSTFRSQEAQAYLLLTEIDHDRKFDHYRAAEKHYEEAFALSPRSKTLALSVGRAYLQHYQELPATESAERTRVRDRAKAFFQTALTLDRSLPEKSMRRLGPQQMQQLTSGLEALSK